MPHQVGHALACPLISRSQEPANNCCNGDARVSRLSDYWRVFMLEAGGPLILSRRQVMMLVAGGLAAWRPLSATTSGFWNKKAPGDWSSEEIDTLITKSPWAK